MNLEEEHKCKRLLTQHSDSQFHGTDCNQISDTATKSQDLTMRRNYFWLGLLFKLQRLKDVWGNVRFSREQLILALTGATCYWIINTRPVLANIEAQLKFNYKRTKYQLPFRVLINSLIKNLFLQKNICFWVWYNSQKKARLIFNS